MGVGGVKLLLMHCGKSNDPFGVGVVTWLGFNISRKGYKPAAWLLSEMGLSKC